GPFAFPGPRESPGPAAPTGRPGPVRARGRVPAPAPAQPQSSPFRERDRGVPGPPSTNPLNPTATEPPGAMRAFQPESETTTDAPSWRWVPFHRLVISSPSVKSQARSQPSTSSVPVLVTVTEARKPPGQVAS